jgi:hypothetical protein
MANQRPKLVASEIEAVLRAALQKLPSLRGTQAVRIRPYSGPEKFHMGGGQDQTGSGVGAV